VIYPTRRAVIVAAIGLPVALLVGVLTPAGWLSGRSGSAWSVLAMIADALSGGSRGRLALDTPDRPTAGRGAPGATASFTARFTSARAPSRPRRRWRRTPAGPGHALRPGRSPRPGGDLPFDLTPERRGDGKLSKLWVRWTGPLGLVWKQKSLRPRSRRSRRDRPAGVREDAVRMLARDALIGAKTQIDRGEGSEFEALRDFQPGMDRRAIDWKQSARHAHLLAKEFRTERNHHVVMALDCGRAMCEPVGGAPRIDRAINAGLLLAYACLRSGDRAGFFAFDSAPRLLTGVAAAPTPSASCSTRPAGSTTRPRRPTTPWP
jgi:uncharacterized protein (DUF58 family)